MYEDGELDYVQLPSASVENYEGQDHAFLNGNVDFFYWNTASETCPALTNVNFRLALNYALDRNTYNTLVNNDLYVPTTGLCFSGLADAGSTWGENSKLQGYPLDGDADQAVEYLNTALSELGISSASDITLTITTSDNDSSKRQAECVQEMWVNTLGINVEINQVTYAEVLTRQQNSDYEVIWGGWGADYDDAYSYLEMFKSDSSLNRTGYANAEFDELLNASQTETDAAARSEMLHQAEQILIDEAAFLPQTEREVHYLINDSVEGVQFFHCALNIDWVYADFAE